MEKLKNCPFCGGPAVDVGGDYITCGAPYNLNGNCPASRIRTEGELWNIRSLQLDWQTIDTCPADDMVIFASYYEPSEEAAKNGAMAFWTFGTGSKILGSKMLKPLYSGILGGNPSHWAKIVPPTKVVQGI